MAEKASILQQAQRYMAKGQIDKAINEWQKLISESPNDGNIYNTIGDLFLKKNKLSEATESYLKGAETFHAAGFALKTIAVYKKLIKLVPDRIDLLVKLGDMNAERSLTWNAIQDYLTAAKQYTQKGEIKEALDVYRKISGLDPSNTNIRLKLAEMSLSEGFREEAIEEFLKLVEYHKEKNQTKEMEEVCRRILKLEPNHAGALKLVGKERGQPEPAVQKAEPDKGPSSEEILAEVDRFIEQASFDEAKAKLGPFIEQIPDNPGGHQRLGMILLKTGRKGEAFHSCRTAVKLYMSRKEFGQAGKLMKDFLEIDPDRIDAYKLLAEAYEQGGNAPLAVSAYAHIIDEHLASGEENLPHDLYQKIKSLDPQHRDVRKLRRTFESAEMSQSRSSQPGVPPVQEPTAPPDPVSSPEPDVSVVPETSVPETSAAEAEAPVFVDQAELENLLTEAEVYLKYGLANKAIEQLQVVLSKDPENLTAHEQLKNLYKNEGEKTKALEECLTLMNLYEKAGEGENRTAVLKEAREIDPDHPALGDRSNLSPILDKELNEILKEEPVSSGTSSSEKDSSLSRSGQADAGEITLMDPESSEPIADISFSASQSFQKDRDPFEEEMAEADFYYHQGLKDEAKTLYEKIIAQKPDHAAVRAKLDLLNNELKPRVEAKGGDETSTVAEELDKSFAPFMDQEKEEYVDMSGLAQDIERQEEINASSANRNIAEELDGIFTELQKDVIEQEDDIDYESHYNLGIAYKEMGLLRESIVEFEAARKGSDRYIDSSSMLALCHQEDGNLPDAIKLLEEALSDSRCSESQAPWLQYDLASLYERENRTEEALAVFQKIYVSDRDFKDVGERIQKLQERLGRPVQKTKASKEAAEDEDIDVMMDRIFGNSEPGIAEKDDPSGSADGSDEDSSRKGKISYL